MEFISGFTAAKARLARQVVLDFGKISPGSKETFGREMSPEEVVDKILSDVKTRGDTAVIDYTARFDRCRVSSMEVKAEQIKAAYNTIEPELLEAFKMASRRIRKFHQEQKELVWRGVEGKEWGQLVRPLDKVGLYAPGGTAALASTVLMIAIPPKVAGVKELILATPPGPDGSVPPLMLAAADIARADRVFAMGGAQAIGAMAYGTQSVPKVDKICGPGNSFVVLAKKAVFGQVDIDALQGPSEILVIADESAKAEYCAADLLAQAEHGQLSHAVLLTTRPRLAQEVRKELDQQSLLLPRQQIASESLKNNGVIVILDSIEEAIELANLFAPEHLELVVKNAETYLNRVQNAGCVFLGEYSTEPIGDYIAGPNHSLPTGGTARFSSPLNILDFMKIIDVVKMDRDGVQKLGPAAMLIARAEGLEGHARAIEKRLKS